MDVAEAAEGILRVVTANMNKAIRSILIARGFDVRQFTLMAFGGAGGMVAGELLRIGDVRRLVVPSNPGAVSAIGMLATDLRHDFAQSSVSSRSAMSSGARSERALRRLREHGAERLRSDGVADDAMHFDDALDLRYVGQDYYLRVYVDLATTSMARASAPTFDRLHEHTYGFANPEFEVEMVNARVFAIGAVRAAAASRDRRSWLAGRCARTEGAPPGVLRRCVRRDGHLRCERRCCADDASRRPLRH